MCTPAAPATREHRSTPDAAARTTCLETVRSVVVAPLLCRATPSRTAPPPLPTTAPCPLASPRPCAAPPTPHTPLDAYSNAVAVAPWPGALARAGAPLPSARSRSLARLLTHHMRGAAAPPSHTRMLARTPPRRHATSRPRPSPPTCVHPSSPPPPSRPRASAARARTPRAPGLAARAVLAARAIAPPLPSPTPLPTSHGAHPRSRGGVCAGRAAPPPSRAPPAARRRRHLLAAACPCILPLRLLSELMKACRNSFRPVKPCLSRYSR